MTSANHRPGIQKTRTRGPKVLWPRAVGALRILLSLVSFLFAFSSPQLIAKADQTAATSEVSPVDEGTISFPHGLRLVTVAGGIAEQPTGEREQLAFATVGLNYYFCDNWAFGLEFTGLGAAQDENDAAAGGGDLLLRTHLLNLDRLSFYGDFAAGVLEADHRIPPGGTDFNFTVQTGVGAAIYVNPRADLFMGLRYFHLSNARQEGPSRNPSLNAIEGYAGIMFRM